eukprot:GGOE01019422.1.p1 GENE.GGOE01019422.1~~GGOE01019422.1.p1  ORF type:complete len:1076 (-),score=106.68 GGOE01019422.1:137-3058(-)
MSPSGATNGGITPKIAPDERPLGVRWEVQDDSGGWACFNKDTIARLENAFYSKLPEVIIPSSMTMYSVHPVTEATFRYNTSTNLKRAVRRTNGQLVVKELVWAWMDNDGTWQTYDFQIQSLINHCHSNLVNYAEFSKSLATIRPGHGSSDDTGTYQLLFDDMIQQNLATGHRRPVRKMGKDALDRLAGPPVCIWAWQTDDGGWQALSGDISDQLDLMYEDRSGSAPKRVESPEFGEKLMVDFDKMVLVGLDTGIEYKLKRETGGLESDEDQPSIWMFADDEGGWVNFDLETIKLLEKTYRSGKPATDLPGNDYRVEFVPEMKRINKKTGLFRAVKRAEHAASLAVDASTRVRDETVITEPDGTQDWIPTKAEGPVDLREYDDVVRRCRKDGSKFTDGEFKAMATSFYGTKSSRLPENKCRFKRLDQIPGEWAFSKNGLSAGDIKQGCLGSCWFVSMLSAVAERKDLIDKLLPRQELEPCGAYVVCFYQNGERKPIIVDDFFPVWDYEGCPPGQRHTICTTRGATNQLWVPLMEKAYAKIHGSYSALSGGLSSDALSDLTGAPTVSIELPWKQKGLDINKLWMDLTRYNRLGYLFGAHCGRDRKEINPSVIKKMGLVERHAYTVLKFREVSLRGKTHKIVLLRNPYGRIEWQGDWSDKSRLWTPELRQELQHTNQDDGSFWMPFHDFLTYFHVINVCKVPLTSTYEYTLQHPWAIQAPPTGMMLDFKVVKANTICTFQVFQQSKRGQQSDFMLNDMNAIVAQVFPNGSVERVLAEALMEGRRSALVMASLALDPGRYRIYAFSISGARSGAGHPRHCNIRLSSTEALLVKKMPTSSTSLRSALHLAIDHVVEGNSHSPTKGTLHCYSHEVLPGIYILEQYSSWGRFIVCINKTSQAVKVKYDCSKSRNVITTRPKDQVSDVVPPRSRQILLAVCHFQPHGKWSGTHASRPAFLTRDNHDPVIPDGSIHEPVPLV